MKFTKEKSVRELIRAALISLLVGAVVGAVIFAYKWGAENPIFLLITILVSYLVGGALGAKPLYDDFIAYADLRRGGNARSDRGNRWQAAVKKPFLPRRDNLKV